jgi:hypothetical protein
MDAPLDEKYLTWLYARIGSVKETRPSKTYWSIFRQLYEKEFIWLIPNDDNRVEDGRDMRLEFLDETNLYSEVDPVWMEMPCSFLELIFGLARRLAFEADRTQRYWFWDLMQNLQLDRFTDREYNDDVAKTVDEAVDDVIWRTYSPNGRGGLFPLSDPPADQRDVEIWYQLEAYILERG